MKATEKIMQKPWLYYTITFILLFAVNVFIRWRDPRGVRWADNLATSAVATIFLTAGFIIGDRLRRKNKRTQEEVMKRLKNKEP